MGRSGCLHRAPETQISQLEEHADQRSLEFVNVESAANQMYLRATTLGEDLSCMKEHYLMQKY